MTTGEPGEKSDIRHSLPPGSADVPSPDNAGKSAESGAAAPAARARVKKSHASQKRGIPAPTFDDPKLIAPVVLDVAEKFRARHVVADKTRCRELWPEREEYAGEVVVPRNLVPFVKSCDLRQLALALQRRPWLYRTPLVFAQLFHLDKLRTERSLWKRVAWPEVFNEDTLRWEPPRQVKQASVALEFLMAAHVRGLLPRREIATLEEQPENGRPSGFKNPHPTGDPETEWIDAEHLFDAWWPLLHTLKPAARDLLRRIPTRPIPDFVDRVVAVATVAVSDDPPEWSDLVESVVQDYEPLHVPQWRTRVDLRPIVTLILRDARHRSRMRHAGPSAYLASAILAAHLDQTPEKVQDCIDAYFKSRPEERAFTRLPKKVKRTPR